MNATIAVQRPASVGGPSVGLRQAVAASVAAARRRATGASRGQKVLALSAAAGVLFAAAAVTAGPYLAGYLGVFGLSVLTNATIFLPTGRGAIMVAGALVLNPLAVAVLTGIGGALGEITGYWLGRSSRRLMKKEIKPPRWINDVAERHMAVAILALSIIPNPFVDAIGIMAGRAGYPLGRFLAYSAIGKVAQSIVFVYVALWNLSLITSWVSW